MRAIKSQHRLLLDFVPERASGGCGLKLLQALVLSEHQREKICKCLGAAWVYEGALHETAGSFMKWAGKESCPFTHTPPMPTDAQPQQIGLSAEKYLDF